MKNKILIIGIIVTIVLAVVIVVFFRNKTNKEEYNGEIVKFEYNYGSYFGGYRNYKIYKENNEVHIVAKGQNGIDLDIDKNVDESVLKEIENLIKRNQISEWNEFNKRDDRVTDGNGFSIKIEYSDGKTIKAEGYSKYPTNYETGHKALSNYLENIK